MTNATPWQERRVIGDAVLSLGDELSIVPCVNPVFGVTITENDHIDDRRATIVT